LSQYIYSLILKRILFSHSEFTRKREEVLQTLQEFQSEAQKVLDIIENPEVLANLRQDKLQNLHYLEKNFGVGFQDNGNKRNHLANCLRL